MSQHDEERASERFFEIPITPAKPSTPDPLITELVGLLKAWIDDTTDYMTRNNLGDPEKQHLVIQSHAALRKAEGGEP